MSRMPRIGITSFLLTVFVALCLPVSLSAMPYRQFDTMKMLDQAEYIAVMVDTTQRVLRVTGGANYAAQIEQLFTTIEPGDSMSLGLVELESNVDRARVADLKRVIKDPKARRLDVEDALFVTLKKNNIPMTQPVIKAVMDAMANFHCMTDAEFEAETPAVQHRYIALLAKIGYPDAQMRQDGEDIQKGEKPSTSPNDPKATKRELDLVAQQFPNESTDQPGFAEVAKKIRIEYATAPNAHGPMFAVMIYLLDLEKADIRKQMKQMEDETYHLPQ